QLLHLPRTEPEPLAGVVAEASEAETLVALHAEERSGELADDAPADGLLAAEAAQPRIEDLGAVPVVEPADLVARGGDEQLGRDDRGPGTRSSSVRHGAKNRRN